MDVSRHQLLEKRNLVKSNWRLWCAVERPRQKDRAKCPQYKAGCHTGATPLPGPKTARRHAGVAHWPNINIWGPCVIVHTCKYLPFPHWIHVEPYSVGCIPTISSVSFAGNVPPFFLLEAMWCPEMQGCLVIVGKQMLTSWRVRTEDGKQLWCKQLCLGLPTSGLPARSPGPSVPFCESCVTCPQSTPPGNRNHSNNKVAWIIHSVCWELLEDYLI